MSPIVLKGYEVNGKVLSNASPVSGVQITITPCPQGATCQTTSNDQGAYSFVDIPVGSYSLAPYFKGFQVAPAQVSITVKHDTLKVDPSFEVKGFTIFGNLEDVIANVDIFVNGKKVAKTDNEGKFELHEISSGNKYTIEAKLQNYVFEKIENAQFVPATPRLAAPIRVTHVHVCGHVKLQSQVFALAGRKVLVAGTPAAAVDEAGNFCAPVPKNTAAKISIAVSDEEKKQGLLLKPLSIDVPDHLEKPITDTSKFVFSQQMLNLFGKIKMLAGVSAAGLTVNAQLLRTGTITSTKATEDGSFAFNNVLPGNSYRVSVAAANTGLCWFQQGQQKVEIIDTDVSNVELKQDGFLLSIQSNIEGVTLTREGSNDKYVLEKATIEKCVREPGVQRFVATSPSPCIQLDQANYEFDTAKPAKIVVSAVRYLIRGEVAVPAATTKSSDDVDDTITIQVTGSKTTKSNLPTTKQGNSYNYEFWAPFDESFTFEPKSGLFLFEPKTVSFASIATSTKCPHTVAVIKGIRGTFLRGNVHPSVANADVKVFKKSKTGKDELVVTVKTDAQGNYRAGPLYSGAPEEYNVVAEKQGFHLIRSPNNPLDYTATKLVSLQVNALLKEAKTALPSVFVTLVSTSAGNSYRTNGMTNEQGQVTFSGLFPGAYFVKPLLKEYVFEPKDVQVEVKENGNNIVNTEAVRVAFSAMGTVRSLNGKPLAGVLVEARPESSTDSVDETRTDNAGSFRIRGLKPKEKYLVRVRPSSATVERATPESIVVQQNQLEDVQNLEFLSFSSFGFTSELISGHVDVPIQFITGENLVSTPNPIIEVELLAGKDPMNVKIIKGQKLTVSRYFQFIVPKNEAQPLNYYIRLSTNLNKQAYQFTTPMVAAKQQLSYTFRPTLKIHDQQDTKFAGIASAQYLQFFILVALTVMVILYFNSSLLDAFRK